MKTRKEKIQQIIEQMLDEDSDVIAIQYATWRDIVETAIAYYEEGYCDDL